MLIAIDGIDGAGKTTLAQQLVELLAALNPIIEKEPTKNSEWGRLLRNSATSGRLSREKELEYFHKDRLHHLENVVIPALERGQTVILDRYVDSTLAFQCDTPEEAEKLYQAFLPEIRVPDVTFILDCPTEIGLRRVMRSRGERSTFETNETLKKAEKIYRSRKGPTYVHIDATGSVEQTFMQAVEILVSRFDLKSVINLPSGSSTCFAQG